MLFLLRMLPHPMPDLFAGREVQGQAMAVRQMQVIGVGSETSVLCQAHDWRSPNRVCLGANAALPLVCGHIEQSEGGRVRLGACSSPSVTEGGVYICVLNRSGFTYTVL